MRIDKSLQKKLIFLHILKINVVENGSLFHVANFYNEKKLQFVSMYLNIFRRKYMLISKLFSTLLFYPPLFSHFKINKYFLGEKN